jgi:vacuolar protein sorting-associated protein 13A/C
MHLTAQQYAFLLDLSKLVPQTFATTEEEAIEDGDLDAQVSSHTSPVRGTSPESTALSQKAAQEEETVDLFPELAKVAVNEQGETVQLFSKLEFAFTVTTVYLELFTKDAFTQADLKNHSLARFSLNEADIKYKMVSNGSMEAEVLLRSFVSSLCVQSDRFERD